MGGKRNQAQRTKNNVKPSSSSRSADLLGKDATKLVGLISLKQNMFACKPDLLSSEELDAIDPNFQVSLKKLSKKDAITKQKGLQELTDLFKKSGVEACKALLPFWSQVYCNLSLDVDNKVRENTQLAHQALAACVGRNLAPHIRHIAPVWFTSQFDTYPPAASTAVSSLKATFPENKVKDVMSFCHNEIFSFLYDNLINQTPQTLSKPDMSKEDSQAKYERVIICSLNGYSHYIETLSTGLSQEAEEKFMESNKRLLTSNKYWNFASHKTSLIRAAWYASLISLCKNARHFVKDESKHLLKSVFSNLDESDPLVLPLVWESSLYCLQIFNEDNVQMNLEKLVFPKLCCILEKGGLGNASTIYPNLLPLLSNISTTLTSDKNKFYQTFFASLLSGLKEQSVKLSQSESEVIVATFMECFRYVVLLNNEDRSLCEQLIQQQLLQLVKDVESDKVHRCTVVSLYYGLAELTCYWLRSISSYPSYDCYWSCFWEALQPSFVESLTSSIHDPPQAVHILYCHHKFFQTFLNPQIRNKKNLKVKFDCDKVIQDPVIAEDSLNKINIDSQMKQNLEVLGGELLKLYYSYTSDQVSNDFRLSCISQLSQLVKLLGFDFFLASCNIQCSEFCSTLHSWLKDSSIPVEPVLVLTFTALASITEEQLKKTLLEDLIQLRPEMLIEEAVRLCMTGRQEYNEISSWLKNDNVRSVLVSFVEAIHNENSGKTLQVLKYCLSSCRLSDCVIGDNTVTELIEKLISKLENADIEETKRIVSIFEEVLREDTVLFWKHQYSTVFRLATAVFSKTLSFPQNSLLNILHKSVSYCFAVSDISSEHFKKLVQDCGLIISEKFINKCNKVGIAGLVNISHALLESLTCRADESSKRETAIELSKIFLITVKEEIFTNCSTYIEEVSVMALSVHGDIPFKDHLKNYFMLDNGVWNPLGGIKMASFCQAILFSLKLMFRLLGEDIDETCSESLISNEQLDRFNSLILDYTFSLALIRTVSEYYSSTEQYFDSVDFIDLLAPCLKELVQRLPQSHYAEMFSALDRIKEDRPLWFQANEIIRGEFLEMEKSESENVNERILTSNLEQDSLRSLRNKLMAKKKGLDKFIQFICWKFETSNKAEATALYNKSLNNVGVLEMCLSAEIARFLTELIKYNDTIIETKTWNFIIDSIAAWSQSLEKTQNPNYCKEYVSFVIAYCNLFVTLSVYVEADLSDNNSLSHAKEERIKYIKKNWDIFSMDVHFSILNCWKTFAVDCSRNVMEPVSIHLIENLSTAVCHIAQSGKLIFKENYELVALTRACSELILSPCPSVQISSFLVLQSIVADLAKLDSGLDENASDKISCLHLKDTLLKTQTVVQAMLQDFKLGVMCLVAPFTDSYIYTRAYLMSWLVILGMFKAADSQTRHLYTCWMKEERILNHLMDCLLRLLPNFVAFASESNVKKIQETFSIIPSFCYSGWTSARLSSLSGHVYIHVLRVLPLLSRLWYSECEPKKRDFADKLTAPYVSPLLVNEEINFVLNETKKWDNLSLETLPTARLVNAIFSVEDSKAELVIQLAQNHPFTPPKVDISKSVVSSNQTKQKLKQLTLFPILQNGSLWDCIIVWKNYLDKKFEGVEECYICYSVLHYGSHQLPKLTCWTCKKKFHSACLYKWFTSSNKATCPICRNLF